MQYLLALIADRIAGTNYALGRAFGGKPKKPRPLPRPGDEDKGRIGNRGDADPAAVRAYLDRFKPGANTAPEPAQEETVGGLNAAALAQISSTTGGG